MAELTPIAQYVLERAEEARDLGMTEAEFVAEWETEVAAWTETPIEVDDPSDAFVHAVEQLRAHDEWPWHEPDADAQGAWSSAP